MTDDHLKAGYAAALPHIRAARKAFADAADPVEPKVSSDVAARLERIAGSVNSPGGNRNMMLKPSDAQAILATLRASDPSRELVDALQSIRAHCREQPSALAKAIVATCDAALAQGQSR